MSKFFTWTKGDRTHATDVLRSSKDVPFAYIHADDTRCAVNGSSPGAAGRKPPPLKLSDHFVTNANAGNDTNDSLALQNAAVRSATTLMTVMNDVLRSPQLSAHLAASNVYWNEHVPLQQRPRARTAPSTPLCEAPLPDPVELPGSTPGDDHKPSKDPVIDGTLIPSVPRLAIPLRPLNTGVDHSIAPTNSPSNSHFSSTNSMDRRHDSKYHQQPNHSPLKACGSNAEEFVPSHSDLNSTSREQILRPSSASKLSPPKPRAPLSTLSKAEDVLNPSKGPDTQSRDELSPMGAESTFKNHVSGLRASHEQYIQNLKQAHKNEIDFYKGYIQLLEQDLTSNEAERYLQNGIPITTDIAGREAPVAVLSHQDRSSNNTVSCLSAELAAVESERVVLLDRLKGAEKKIYEASQRENALKQEVLDLCTRLETSHQLEAPHTPPDSGQSGLAKHRQDRTVSDLGIVSETAHPLLHQIRDLRKSVLEKDTRIRELEEASKQRSQLQTSSCAPSETQSIQAADLMLELANYKQLLSSANAEIEQYNSLLHAEIRRCARDGNYSSLSPGPEVRAHSSAITSEKMTKIRAKAATLSRDGLLADTLYGSAVVSLLEKELYHCICLIVTHKLDLRACRRELRRAHMKIRDFQASFRRTSELPNVRMVTEDGSAVFTPTSEMQSREPKHSNVSPDRRNASASAEESVASVLTIQAGLGVSIFDVPKRTHHDSSPRERSNRSASPAASPQPPRQSSAATSPRTEPRTPLRIDKDLPEPPFSAPEPSSPTKRPPNKMNTMDSLRSFSDSVLPSSTAQKQVHCRELGSPLSRNAGSYPVPTIGSAGTLVASSAAGYF